MYKNKYVYYRIIQTQNGRGWDDDDFHETDSSGFPYDMKAFKENLKAYKDNYRGLIRVINRREIQG